MASEQAFEDHCWKDVIPDNVVRIYSKYVRRTFVGPSPALLLVDLYDLVYQGGPLPIDEAVKVHSSSCGEYAFAAIEPTKRLIAAARRAGLPIFYTTGDARPDARPRTFGSTRHATTGGVKMFGIRADFAPQPGDIVITKQRASGFFGTPLGAQLTQVGARSVIICGESTSGCVRATAVDAHSSGFHVVLAEECCFDRSEISHKVSLFDLHHKYADVMHTDEIVAHLDGLNARVAE
ncbi:MAG: isochorismatase family protein [Gemmatimonas sp.]